MRNASSLLSILVVPFSCLAWPGVSTAQPFLFGSDQAGNLTRIDTATGAGTLIGTEPNFPLSTEIEWGLGQLFSEEFNGFLNLHTINPATGLSTGFVTHGPAAFNGMEFVGATLYVANVATSGGGSTLEIVNPSTGAQTMIGATGFGPISGLAYDPVPQTMYGVTGGGAVANLLTINLGTGVATPGPVLFDAVSGAPLDHVGSIEFASNGVLYGGMGLNASINPGWLFSINTATGASTFIGPTGLQGITGLTDIPGPASIGLLAIGLWGVSFRRGRRV